MATRSEDIRLQMNNVRYKKGDGTLYLMAERLGWMPDTKDNFTISHKYSDIRTQKISPDGKPKIQLQLVLHTGDNTTFQFASKEDRTAVKDALLQILPLFKDQIPEDRKKKGLILSKNTHLLQLYKDLVESRLITADEFWSQFTEDVSETVEAQVEQQEVGVSADYFSGISLTKQYKGSVNVETLWAILKTYPKVAEKHRELVPVKMTETEFWNKFFQSRYFNRDRTKDLFSDCFKSEEKEFTSSVKKGRVDPIVDLSKFDREIEFISEEPTTSLSNANQDQILMKRFTQQSIRLMGSLESRGSDKARKPAIGGEPKREPEKSTNAGDSSETSDGRYNMARRDLGFDDLAGQECFGDFLDDQSKIDMRSRHFDRELYSIVPQAQQNPSQVSGSITRDHADAIRAWEPRLNECLNPKDATDALKHLSPAGYLMRSSNNNRLADTVPEELQTKIKTAYFASNELLRHFWLCFPAVDSSLEAKLTNIYETLKKFESNKLKPLEAELPSDQRHLLNHIMRVQFRAASRKYDHWKSKKHQREQSEKHRN